MKVLVSSFQCLPNEGSELGNGWHWASALADAGHEVTVLTQRGHVRSDTAPSGIEFLGVDVPTTRWHGKVSRLGANGQQLCWFDQYVGWQDAALRFMRQQHRTQFDVVHHVTWGSLHLGSELWRLGTPLVYGPIGGGQVAPRNYWRQFGRGWPAEMVRTLSTTDLLLHANARSRETIRNAAVTLVTNSATADACRRLGSRDVRYMLADGLPPERLAGDRQRPGGTPTVLWVGRFLPRKAPMLAVEAFAELRRRIPARLVMAGDGSLFEETRALVSRLGLEGDVELLGRVPWTELTGLYDSASAFLFTSLRDSFGSQFLEALGRGLPAVALDHHGIGDADVGAAAVKVILPPDPRDLAVRLGNALHEVVTGDAWSERSAAGVAWAAQHTWPAKAAQSSTIYDEMLGSDHAVTA